MAKKEHPYVTVSIDGEEFASEPTTGTSSVARCERHGVVVTTTMHQETNEWLVVVDSSGPKNLRVRITSKIPLPLVCGTAPIKLDLVSGPCVNRTVSCGSRQFCGEPLRPTKTDFYIVDVIECDVFAFLELHFGGRIAKANREEATRSSESDQVTSSPSPTPESPATSARTSGQEATSTVRGRRQRRPASSAGAGS